MGNLIDGVLELSRLSRRRFVRAQVDTSALPSEVVAELQDNQPDRRVEIEIQGRAACAGGSGSGSGFRTRSPTRSSSAPKRRARIRFGAVVQDAVPVYFVAGNGAGFDMAHSQGCFSRFIAFIATASFPATGSACRPSCGQYVSTAA